jgi:LacI family transcriptional regulator
MTRVSLKDIAQELGVSTAAISLVLNGKEKEGRIGGEMSERIRQKAKEMNYQPNTLARGLRIGKSSTIGLIVADISNLFFASLAFHIQEEVEKFGYTVIITNTNESDQKMEKMMSVLKNRLVDGLIVVPTEHGEPLIQNLVDNDFPTVLVDRYYADIHVASVIVDNYNASKKAIRNLIEKGCKNIALIVYTNELQHTMDRKNGCIDELQSAGLYNPDLVKAVNYSSLETDIAAAVESLLSDKNRVDGIFFATNTLSMHGIRCLLKKNSKFYENIHVVCFDKSDAFEFAPVHIPYIQQPIAEMGRTAVHLLMDQIKKKAIESTVVELPTVLVNGD